MTHQSDLRDLLFDVIDLRNQAKRRAKRRTRYSKNIGAFSECRGFLSSIRHESRISRKHCSVATAVTTQSKHPAAATQLDARESTEISITATIAPPSNSIAAGQTSFRVGSHAARRRGPVDQI